MIDPVNVLSRPRSGSNVVPVAGGTDRRVLVVDDSAVQRNLLATRLRRWGYTVTEAANGADALAIARETPFPLILSDWMMPMMSGPAFCRALRRAETGLHSHFILLTSRSEKTDVQDGLGAGADDFLSKPVDEGELAARLDAGWRVIELQQKLLKQRQEMADAYRRLKALHDQLDQDLQVAASLQQAFLPPRHAVENGLAVAALCRSVGHVGGDHVGFVRLGASALGVYCVDVSGHGVASALIAVQLAQAFKAPSAEENIAFTRGPDGTPSPRAPHEVVADLNARFSGDGEHDLYFTMTYAVIDALTGEVRICRAGHPETVVLGRDGSVRCVGTGGPPVGLLPEMAFDDSAFTLARGERLLLHSDGITEAVLRDGSRLEFHGLERLLQGHPSIRTADLIDTVMDRLKREMGDLSFDDDISLVLVERPLQPEA